jgi:hypothetical protein
MNTPLPFGAAKSYRHLFSEAEIQATAELIRFLASPECWYRTRRYFDGYYVPNETEDVRADVYGSMLRDPEIILLMSFPNSGTSYTIMNVEEMTRSSAATNNVREIKYKGPFILARSDMKDGPFVLEPEMGKPWPFILSKSHCAGFCDSCKQNLSYADVSIFEKGCRSTLIKRNGKMEASHYNATAIKKLVHIFRNPIDNLVARMHLGIKRRRLRLGWSQESLSNFTDTKQGLLAWCHYVDSEFGSDPSYFPERARDMFADVPCYSEMFRYVQWHNLAIQMIEQYGVPAHNIFYEDYETKYDETVGDLLKFLEANRTHEIKPFIRGKRYGSLFRPRHLRGIARLIRRMASPECWKHLKRYFPEFDMKKKKNPQLETQ